MALLLTRSRYLSSLDFDATPSTVIANEKNTPRLLPLCVRGRAVELLLLVTATRRGFEGHELQLPPEPWSGPGLVMGPARTRSWDRPGPVLGPARAQFAINKQKWMKHYK